MQGEEFIAQLGVVQNSSICSYNVLCKHTHTNMATFMIFDQRKTFCGGHYVQTPEPNGDLLYVLET